MTGPGHSAFVLAAGLGHRMRPLTANKPKPLIEVNGKALIEYGIEKLRAAGVSRIIVNVHYLAGQIESWAGKQPAPEIEISDEREELLDTGGGIARAIARLGPDPFFVVNSDSFWIDSGVPALERLRREWDGAKMDCLLLLCPLTQTVGYDGAGDFVRDSGGMLARASGSEGEPFVYAGGYLVSPRLFENCPPGRFSMNVLWDRAIEAGRLFGLVHRGRWIHVGTPGSIAPAEAALRE